MTRRHLSPLALFLLAACTPALEAPDAGSSVPDPVVCEETSECPDRSLCVGGVCQDVGDGGCTTKAECVGGNVCVSGTCAAPPASCSSSEECPGALVCDGFSRACIDLNAGGCQVQSDCALEPGCGGGCTCEGDGTCRPLSPNVDAGPSPTDAGPPVLGGTINLSGFRIENWEYDPAIHIGVLPDGTTLAAGQHLVLARNATKSAFEAFWGVSLGSGVVYLNAELAGGGVPNINGDETWALISPVGSVLDETAIGPNKDSCYHRVSTGAGVDPDNWVEDDMANANPGTSELPSSGVGLVIDQWSDAEDYNYEFLQIYYAP